MNTPAPPVISFVSVLPFTDTSVLVDWTTNQLADSQVSYGLTAAYDHTSGLDPTLTASHGQVLTGLDPSTTYHYRVTSRNSLGLTASSGDLTFTTPRGHAPELPRTYLDTTYKLPTGGATISVGAGDDLQAAIDEANPGDVIVLEAGATFTGNFVLHNKP